MFSQPTWSSRRLLAALIGIVAVSAAIRAYLFRGYVGLDDAEYAHLAYQLAYGSFHSAAYTGPVVFPLRIGVIMPTAILFRVFGVHEWTMVLYPFIVSVLSIALIYLCTSLWFGQAAGLISAALMTIFPWDIDNATKLLPDLPAAFFGAAGITTIVFVERLGVRRRSLLFGAGALAGVFLGYSWLCKESVAYLAPFCAALMVLTLRNRGSSMLYVWGGVAAGSLPILLGEMITYHGIAGDFLFRFHAAERDYHQNAKYFFAEGSDFGWKAGDSRTHALVNRLFVSGPAAIFVNRSMLFMPTIGLVAMLYAWLRRDRSFLVPAVWLWTLVLMFNFSSSSTTSYAPLVLLERYMYPIFFPSIVLVSGFFAKTIVLRHEPARREIPILRLAGALTAVCLLWIGGKDVALAFKYPPTWWLKDVRIVKAYVTPDSSVYADTLSLRAFEFFEGYPKTTAWTDFERLGSPEELPPGSLVVVNNQFIQWLDSHGGIWGSRTSGYRQFPFYSAAPRSWTRLWQNGNLSLYRVNERSAGMTTESSKS